MGRMFLSHRYEVQYYWSDVIAKFYSLKITWVETAKCSCVTTFNTPLKNESANIPSWTTFESEIWQTESTHYRWSFTSHTLSCTKIFSINELNFNLKHPFCLLAECNPSHFRENSVKSGFFFFQSIQDVHYRLPFPGLCLNSGEFSQNHSIGGGGGICSWQCL